jgi:predicted ATP-binding protein involved in virulence
VGRLLAGNVSTIRSAPQAQLDGSVTTAMLKSLEQLLPGSGGMDASNPSHLRLFGLPVHLRDLSAGYNSLLALVGALFRHALAVQDWKLNPTILPGIALVDEIDSHLHPSWQRRVLPDLCSVFPRIQVIATSHSPMVAGSVPKESLVVLRRERDLINVMAETPDVKGLRADQILTGPLFDLKTTRDIETERKLAEYSDWLQELGPEDPKVRDRARELAATLNLDAEEVVDQRTYELLDELIRKRFKHLDRESTKQVRAKAMLVLADSAAPVLADGRDKDDPRVGGD